MTRESATTNCSIVINAGEIPEEAVRFANAVAELAEANGIRDFELDCTVDTGVFSEIWKNEDRRSKQYHSRLKVHYQAKDGRQRPCRRLSCEVDTKINVPIEWNPASSD